LKTMDLMTEEEFDNGIYEEYLYIRYGQIYNKVHGTNEDFYYKEYKEDNADQLDGLRDFVRLAQGF